MHNHYPYLNIRGYKSLAQFDFNTNKKGESKHYVVGVKEWPNSVYSFNKSNLKDLFANDVLAKKVIKSYFNLDMVTLSSKSKRMRNLIKRSSTKQIFVSDPTIKQTADKAIVGMFLFDRTKKKFNKKLFYLKNDLNNLLNNNNTKRKIRSKQYRKVVTRHSTNLSTYPKLLNLAFLRKKQNIKTLFLFYFFKWCLSAFKLKLIFLKKGDKLIQNNISLVIVENAIVIYSFNEIGTRVQFNSLLLDSKEFYKIINVKEGFTISNMLILNDILYKYLYILLSKQGENKTQIVNRIFLLFKFFITKHYKSFIKKFLKKEFLTLNYLYKLYITKLKVTNLLPGLKYIFSQIYNKKIELNIINLKYLHLNSDIFTSAIVVKLRKKTSKLLRILRKSLKLVKVPEKITTGNYSYENIYDLKIKDHNFISRSIYGSNNSVKDILSNLFNKMFNVSNNEYDLDNNILTSLKYKWVTGARLEAKGRLTKRFTASRSLFKFKYKGNLKNMDYLNKSMNMNKTSHLYLIRNEFKPNIQYSVANSKKRIGTFGIKGWISNN